MQIKNIIIYDDFAEKSSGNLQTVYLLMKLELDWAELTFFYL